MIVFTEGTVFNVNTQALVNTVNCTGVMGAGIALEFSLRYPEMYIDYESKCKSKLIRTGKIDYYKYNESLIIVNFPTKWHFKYPSKLIWIEQGLQNFVDTYKEHNISSIAFPRLGTNKGGLKWNQVKELMLRYLSNLDIDIYICLDKKQEAEGIEKSMLDSFNSYTIEQLSEIVRLNKKQRINIQDCMPYDRFWKIAETEGVGIKTYSAIFKHFYNYTLQGNTQYQQESLDRYIN